jgi:ABC-type nitrate/sulfonate/bicarbonate transport system permease component
VDLTATRAQYQEPPHLEPTFGQRLAYRVLRPGLLLPLAALIGFLSFWQWVSGRVDPLLFPSPWEVAVAFDDLVRSGVLWPAMRTSLSTLFIGFGISLVIGLVGGVLTGRIPLLRLILNPYLEAIYATPRVVIVPLVILWFGVGDSGRLFLVVIGTFIPIWVNTAIGMDNARKDLIEVATSFGANEREIVWHAVLPGAVPYIVTGMRVGIGRALIGVVVAEIFLDLTGLGGLIQTSVSYFQVDRMIAVVLIYAMLGILLMLGAGLLEKRFSTWR